MGQIMGFELEGGGHECVAAFGDAPAAGPGDFGQQAVCAQHVESAVDPGRQPATFQGAGWRMDSGSPQQITAGKAVEGVFAAQDGGEQRGFALAQGVEPPGATRLAPNRFADGVEGLYELGEVFDTRETLQVTLVGLEGDFRVTGKVANMLGHPEPPAGRGGYRGDGP